MRRAKVIIGANYGDEGKGLFTDYYASRGGERTVVIRHNGGAQAGHTVCTPDGNRHVFSHFSSGSFCGAHTYLAGEFLLNPILFHAELAKLRSLGLKPRVLASRICSVTTPMDMWLNMAAEDTRGANRHGSVGVGINETLVRREQGIDITSEDLADDNGLRQRLREIENDWVPRRAEELGCLEVYERLKPKFDLSRFVADCQTFREYVRFTNVEYCLPKYRTLIFEGAQGLGLSYNVDPVHSTPSHTGLTNVIQVLHDSGVKHLDVTYVTRSYLTRHGNGPMEHELPEGQLPYAKVVDTTNKPHPYQGKLRFGYLDVDAMWRRIEKDYRHHAGGRSPARTVGSNLFGSGRGRATIPVA
jgi:adenylosuccinate synthase